MASAGEACISVPLHFPCDRARGGTERERAEARRGAHPCHCGSQLQLEKRGGKPTEAQAKVTGVPGKATSASSRQPTPASLETAILTPAVLLLQAGQGQAATVTGSE